MNINKCGVSWPVQLKLNLYAVAYRPKMTIGFYPIALQVAAIEARSGHDKLAQEFNTVDKA